MPERGHILGKCRLEMTNAVGQSGLHAGTCTCERNRIQLTYGQFPDKYMGRACMRSMIVPSELWQQSCI